MGKKACMRERRRKGTRAQRAAGQETDLKVERHAAALALKVQLFVKGDVGLGTVNNDLWRRVCVCVCGVCGVCGV